MPFLKILKNFKILLVFFCLFAIFFWQIIKEKKAIYNCKVEVVIEQQALKYVNQLDIFSELFKDGIKGKLIDNKVVMEKIVSNEDECGAGFLALVNNSVKNITSKVKRLQMQDFQAIEEEMRVLNKDLESLRNELARLNEKKEKLQAEYQSLKKQRDDIKKAINNLEIEKERLLLVYTPQHPDIINIEQEIKLRKNKLKQIPTIEKSSFMWEEELSAKSNEYQGKKEKLLFLEEEKQKTLAVASKVPFRTGEVSTITLQKESAPKRNKVFALSIILSLAGFFIFLSLDKTIYRTQDMKNLENFNIITQLPKIKKKSKIFNLAFDSNYKSTKAAFKKIISFLKEKKVIFISSFKKNEGKTILALNLGAFLAKEGKKIVLVDFNFRNPTLTQKILIEKQGIFINDILGQQNIHKRLFNFSSLILDNPDLEQVITRGGLDRLSVLFAKEEKDSNLRIYKKLIDTLKENCDYIICDCTVFDGHLADVIDQENALVFVLRRGYTKLGDVLKIQELLRANKRTTSGLVFNLCI